MISGALVLIMIFAVYRLLKLAQKSRRGQAFEATMDRKIADQKTAQALRNLERKREEQ